MHQDVLEVDNVIRNEERILTGGKSFFPDLVDTLPLSTWCHMVVAPVHS